MKEYLRTSIRTTGSRPAKLSWKRYRQELNSSSNTVFSSRTVRYAGSPQRRVAGWARMALLFAPLAPHSTSRCVNSILVLYQARIVNSRVQVEERKRATLPVLCFEGEIRQVLNNLIGNAIDAMHPSVDACFFAAARRRTGPRDAKGW